MTKFTYPMSATFADTIMKAVEVGHGDPYEREVWEATAPTDDDYWSDQFTHRTGLHAWKGMAEFGPTATGALVDAVTLGLITESFDMFNEGPDYVRFQIDGDEVIFRAGFWRALSD